MLLSGDVLDDAARTQVLGVLGELTPNIGYEPGPVTPAVSRQIEAEIPYLQRIVRRWQRDAADADDLVQETLLRALANAHLWQPGSNLRAWLVTIMRNQFFATMSRTQRWAEAAELLGQADSSAADAEARLTLRDVQRAFGRLPTHQRAAVLLAGIEGKSYAEVADTLGLSVDAVRCHLARARDRLRTAVYRADECSPIRSTPSQRQSETESRRKVEYARLATDDAHSVPGAPNGRRAVFAAARLEMA